VTQRQEPKMALIAPKALPKDSYSPLVLTAPGQPNVTVSVFIIDMLAHVYGCTTVVSGVEWRVGQRDWFSLPFLAVFSRLRKR
jgi:hypothetical protein